MCPVKCSDKALKMTIKCFLIESMGVRRGGQEGALDPPWPAKIVCFLTFFRGK